MRLGLRLNDLGIGDRPETYPRSTYPKRMEGALQGKKESGRNNPSFLNHHGNNIFCVVKETAEFKRFQGVGVAGESLIPEGELTFLKEKKRFRPRGQIFSFCCHGNSKTAKNGEKNPEKN